MRSILPMALALAAVWGTARAAPVPEARPHAVIPGGVTDADDKTGYLACPGGVIDAVDLATGERRWRSKAAERPLAVVGPLLAALASDDKKANVARVVLLDTHGPARNAVG